MLILLGFPTSNRGSWPYKNWRSVGQKMFRSRQDSNLRSQRESDFQSDALTTRPRLLLTRADWKIFEKICPDLLKFSKKVYVFVELQFFIRLFSYICVLLFLWFNKMFYITSILKLLFGGAGYRSPYLSHAKRALYHLRYTPKVIYVKKILYLHIFSL